MDKGEKLCYLMLFLWKPSLDIVYEVLTRTIIVNIATAGQFA